jgi:GMP synthase (glutamine-hydrolysing)
MRRVLIVQAGSADAAVRARFGDYPAFFARRLQGRVALSVVRPYERPLPSPAPFHGVVVTGSPRSVTRPEPWMDAAADWLLDAARRVPVLGVCFGHQLLARALGGVVERNPRGREAGTGQVCLTREGRTDPLFAGLPERFEVQQTHADHVTVLPAAARLLATGELSPVQAFGAGALLRCVQFHPEIDAARSRLINEQRRALLDREAPGGAPAVLGSIRPTPSGEVVLGNWLDRFVGVPRPSRPA